MHALFLEFCGQSYTYHVLLCALFVVCGDTGSLAPLMNMTAMLSLALSNNQFLGASSGVCSAFGCMLVKSRLSVYCFLIALRFVLLIVFGESGSLAPLSGMTQMYELFLNNNQITGASANCCVLDE